MRLWDDAILICPGYNRMKPKKTILYKVDFTDATDKSENY